MGESVCQYRLGSDALIVGRARTRGQSPFADIDQPLRSATGQIQVKALRGSDQLVRQRASHLERFDSRGREGRRTDREWSVRISSIGWTRARLPLAISIRPLVALADVIRFIAGFTAKF